MTFKPLIPAAPIMKSIFENQSNNTQERNLNSPNLPIQPKLPLNHTHS